MTDLIRDLNDDMNMNGALFTQFLVFNFSEIFQNVPKAMSCWSTFGDTFYIVIRWTISVAIQHIHT